MTASATDGRPQRANSGQDEQRPSVVRELAGCRAFYVFQLVLLGVSAGLSASQVAWVTGSEDILGSGGVGTLWTAFFLGWAVASIPAGILIDRGNPGRWLVLSCFASATVLVAIGGLMLTHTLAGPVFLALAALLGVTEAIQLPAVLSVQATLVPATAVGAADIVRTCRDAVGVAAGALVLGVLLPPAQMTLTAAVLFAVAGVGVLLVLRRAQRPVESSVGMTDSAPDQTGMAGVIRAAQEDPGLRSAAIARLVMIAVTPTMLISLMLVDLRVPDPAPMLSAAVAIGGVLGTLALTAHGIHVNRRRRLLFSFSGFVLLMLLGGALLVDNWLIQPGWQRWLMIVIAALAGGLPMYGNGLLGGLVQQRSPSALRAKIVGVLQVPMLVLQSIVGMVITGLVTGLDSISTLAICAAAVAIAVVALRGFRSIR